MEWIEHYWMKHTPDFEHYMWVIIKAIILWVVARLSITVLNHIISRFLKLKGKMDDRRRDTLESLFTNIAKYAVYFIYILTVLPFFGINIGALLAGAGVAGIAIAFGAQSLIKDFFNGFFIIFEDQYGIGDYVKINDVTGQVHAIGLRMTAVKVWTGEVETIPNGQITQITNYSKFNSVAVIDVKVGYDTPEEEAIRIIEGVMTSLTDECEEIVGEVQVLGVQALNDYNYTIRATAVCEPYNQWGVERKARQRIRQALQEAGADLPLQKIVYLNENSYQKEQS